MGLFGRGKRLKPRGFEYNPRFYDKEKEERESRLRGYGKKQVNNVSAEVLKDRIRTGFKTKTATKPGLMREAGIRSNTRVIIIIFILGLLSYLFFYSNSALNLIPNMGG